MKCEWIDTKSSCNCCAKWRKFLNEQLEILENLARSKQ